jgi:uncharacterized protein (UPF0332 family)
MSSAELARKLVLKSRQCLRTASELQDHDPDGSVNRAYYAMFNIARAALLAAGVPAQDLPRTHNGLIAKFSERGVHSGRMDPELSSALSRLESLRLRADYVETSIDAKTATEAYAQAEAFVNSVQREFSLDAGNTDWVSEPTVARPAISFSLEEERRKARENWLRIRGQTNERPRDQDRGARDEFGHDAGLDE